MLRPVDRAVLAADAPDVAPLLLNAIVQVGRCRGRITEVEAYTADDPASHSRSGPTLRNRSMFGPAGTLYVYLSYGVHRCANVVTGAAGDGQAVLIRAVRPLAGVGRMRERRGPVPDRRLADGPGKLTAALGIDLDHDGTDLLARRAAVRLLTDGTPPPDRPLVGPRVGISRAVDQPWRWRAPSSPTCSSGVCTSGV